MNPNHPHSHPNPPPNQNVMAQLFGGQPHPSSTSIHAADQSNLSLNRENAGHNPAFHAPPPFHPIWNNQNNYYYPPPPLMYPSGMPIHPNSLHLPPSSHFPYSHPQMMPQMPISIASQQGNEGVQNQNQMGGNPHGGSDPAQLKQIENYIVSLLQGSGNQQLGTNSDPKLHSMHQQQRNSVQGNFSENSSSLSQNSSSTNLVASNANHNNNRTVTTNVHKKSPENLNQKQKQKNAKPTKKTKPEKVYQEKAIQPTNPPTFSTVPLTNGISNLKIEENPPQKVQEEILPKVQENSVEVKAELSTLPEGVAEHALEPSETLKEGAEERVEEIEEKKEIKPRLPFKPKPGPPILSKDYVSLSTDMTKLFSLLQPTEGEYQKRLKVVNRLQKLVQTKWPESGAEMHLFGSSANMFGLKDADMDISLIIKDEELGGGKKIVIQLGSLLKKKRAAKDVLSLPRARVPIVKFTEELSNISCDVCINNVLAIHNTKLLSTYAKIDPRVRPLGYIVKYWAKMRKINEPYQGSLSSYAYILMVIHFLQLREPPILPVLQEMTEPGEERKRLEVEGHDAYFYSNMEKLKDFGKANQETVGQLLACFYKHYAIDFDWEDSVVSVRTGKMLSKEEKDWTKPTDKKNNVLFALEDPFEVTHNLGRLVDQANLKVIKYEFMRGYKMALNFEPLGSLCEQYQYKEEK